MWMIAGIEKCGVNGPTGSRYPLTRTHNRWRFNMSSHMDTTWTLSVVQQQHVLSHGHCQWFNRNMYSHMDTVSGSTEGREACPLMGNENISVRG